MLEGLYAIDWAFLKGCCGPAPNVPGLLCTVASEETTVTVRLNVWVELFDCLWHQSTVFSASAAAIPFLLELLTYPDVPDKGFFVKLIAAIATCAGSLLSPLRRDGEEMWRRILAKQGRSLDRSWRRR